MPGITNKPGQNAPMRLAAGRPAGSRSGRIDKDQLEHLLGRMLKSQKTPPQYKAALSQSLARIKGWNNQPEDDDAGKVDIGMRLRAWAQERIYASVDGAYASANMLRPHGGSEDEPAGGAPNSDAPAGGLVPSQNPYDTTNSDVSVADNEVSLTEDACPTTGK